ncbi:oxygenase MpaB family protein [Mycolicibacterium sp. CR10]|uniref:oxygenase MpaB family protein n=1 Tax=Mycolicibacterium sp. CR10 TaxID=2562314 RepID=UPI0010C12F74|nr:oxygenase MpaB family protein [Mycolicibacterium sp. CR10]
MFLPHQIVGQQLNKRFDTDVRRHFFKGMDFAAPIGDPGWFGPGSAVWHVHSHMEALIFGLQCAAYIERLDPSIYWMGIHHSRLVKPESRDAAMPVIDPKGASVRLGHSVAFFIGTAYGSTESAERLALAVRSMHHTIKGTRPDGARYDADDPEWLRWNYATVVWGIATAHELYHPNPLRGKEIDRYYGEFVRVGHALGGTDLPATKQETLDCLKSYLPKLALTYGAAMATGPNLPLPESALNWAVRDTMPSWAKGLIQHRDPNIVERTARRAMVWSIINGLRVASGPVPEFEQAKARVAGGVDPALAPHTVPTHQPGSDPVRTRTELEDAFA